MPQYLCIQRSQASNNDAPSEKPSPAQMEQMMAKFNAWREKYQDKISDMGGPLDGNGKVVSAESVSDDPFVEAKEIVGGYMIVTADNIETAVQISQESPGVRRPGSSVEVREIRTM